MFTPASDTAVTGPPLRLHRPTVLDVPEPRRLRQSSRRPTAPTWSAPVSPRPTPPPSGPTLLLDEPPGGAAPPPGDPPDDPEAPPVLSMEEHIRQWAGRPLRATGVHQRSANTAMLYALFNLFGLFALAANHHRPLHEL